MTPKNLLQFKNILIIRPDMIGDCMLITPAIALIKQKYPYAKISVLARTYTRDIFLNNPHIDEMIEDWYAEEKVRSIKDFRKYAAFIKNKRFDLSVHFYNELPYAALAYFAGIKQRLGDTSKPLLYPFYTLHSNCRWNDLTLHEVEHNILLLKPLGIALSENPPKMEINANLLLKTASDNLVVGIHLGTGKGNKAWLPERYAKVIDYLIHDLKSKVVLTGGNKELAASKIVSRLTRNKAINMVGKTNLLELINLIAAYDLYIGVDTGPLHIAAALNIPTVAIFPTKFVKPSEWGPWQTSNVIVRKAASCSQKCMPKDCPFDDCLKEITEDDVIAGIRTLLDKKGNQTLEGSKIDWFKKSLNVFTNKEDIIRELSLQGYNAKEIGLADNPSKISSQLVKEDINMIHWVGHTRPWALLAAKFMATPLLAIPPVLIYEKQRSDYSTGPLIKLYKRRFNS